MSTERAATRFSTVVARLAAANSKILSSRAIPSGRAEKEQRPALGHPGDERQEGQDEVAEEQHQADPEPGALLARGVEDGLLGNVAVPDDHELGVEKVGPDQAEGKEELADVPEAAGLGRLGRVLVVEAQQCALAVADLEEAHDLARVDAVLGVRRPVLDAGGDALGDDGRLEMGGGAGLRERQVRGVAQGPHVLPAADVERLGVRGQPAARRGRDRGER